MKLPFLMKKDIDYSTSITSDVLPHLTKDKVTEVMKQIQELE